MRIVAGAAGGRRIAVPARGTRPTSERVREAIFNSLHTRMDLDGARALDLYAGSGALGLEALSRGAARARFVEADPRAATVLRRNASSLGLPGVEISVTTVESALAGQPDAPYDLVLLDPPFALDEDELGRVLAALPTRGWLAAGALVVVERSSRNPHPRWPSVVNATFERGYGDSWVYYGAAS